MVLKAKWIDLKNQNKHLLIDNKKQRRHYGYRKIAKSEFINSEYRSSSRIQRNFF